MKHLIILLLFYTFNTFAQDIEFDLEQNTSGIITTDEGTYLVIDKGVIQVDINDAYQEYYRHVYNDSTLINPNTELKSNFKANIIPYISSSNIRNKFEFVEDLNIGLFIQFQKSNELSLTPFGQVYIDSIRSRK